MRRRKIVLLICAFIPAMRSAVVWDGTSLPPASTGARWGAPGASGFPHTPQNSFPVGYFLAEGAAGATCTHSWARFQAAPSWVGSLAGEFAIRRLDLLVAPPDPLWASCPLRLQLALWPDAGAIPSATLGAPVDVLLNGTATSGGYLLNTVAIPAARNWNVAPGRWYGLKAWAQAGCAGGGQQYLRLATVQGPAGSAMWPAAYLGGLPAPPFPSCPGDAAPPTADAALPGVAWAAALSTRPALVLRGSEGWTGAGSAATPDPFPGAYSARTSIPLTPGSREMYQVSWQNPPLELKLVQLRLSLYATGAASASAFNASVVAQVCSLDDFGGCISGSFGFQTPTAVAVPGGGAPPAAQTLDFGIAPALTFFQGIRSALRLRVLSISPATAGVGVALLTCGPEGATDADAALGTPVFYPPAWAANGIDGPFNTTWGPGGANTVYFGCMALRVVPQDAAAAFSASASPAATASQAGGTGSGSGSPTPSPTTSPTASPSPGAADSQSMAGTPSADATGTPSPSATPTGTPSQGASASPSPTPSAAATPSQGGGGAIGAAALAGAPAFGVSVAVLLGVFLLALYCGWVKLADCRRWCERSLRLKRKGAATLAHAYEASGSRINPLKIAGV